MVKKKDLDLVVSNKWQVVGIMGAMYLVLLAVNSAAGTFIGPFDYLLTTTAGLLSLRFGEKQ